MGSRRQLVRVLSSGITSSITDAMIYNAAFDGWRHDWDFPCVPDLPPYVPPRESSDGSWRSGHNVKSFNSGSFNDDGSFKEFRMQTDPEPDLGQVTKHMLISVQITSKRYYPTEHLVLLDP